MKKNKKIILWATLLSVFFAMPAMARIVNNRIPVAHAFYRFAHQNNTYKIERLLSHGYSLESTDSRGNNPLCISVINKDRPAYDVLVSYGAKRSPACLRRISPEAYNRFFNDSKSLIPALDTPDRKYLIGIGVVGISAAVAAYIFRGDRNSDSSTSGCYNGTYDKETKTCKCNDGYGNYGNERACYATVENCKTQSLNKCTVCEDNYALRNNVCEKMPEKTCPHGTYDNAAKKCNCDAGYKNYGDNESCYATVPNCKNQTKDTCSECVDNYVLYENVCYKKINNCKTQIGDKCKECYSGFGTYGDDTTCYRTIENCIQQQKDQCLMCKTGYGTFGDPTRCYKKIEHCQNQLQDVCLECESGYSTYGDPTAHICYNTNPCSSYPNTVPYNSSSSSNCRCNENKGYFGEKENCQQAEPDEYHEGDGNIEEWSNLNEKYCHSHGTYNQEAGICLCYKGYKNTGEGFCAGCDDDYLMLNGACYYNLHCEEREFEKYDMAIYEQRRDQCVCTQFMINGECVRKMDCPEHQYQTGENECTCKENFNADCTACIDPEKYVYKPETDTCDPIPRDCATEFPGEKWSGADCKSCPRQYEITYDTDGIAHCGNKCAADRADISANPDCSVCAEGYEENRIDGTCVKTKCSAGEEGYIIIDGKCVCDEANGYISNFLGACVKKEADVIGIKDSNINNSVIDVTNDGPAVGFRNVYGMAPVITNDDGSIDFYDEVYNALSSFEEQTGIINISNANATANSVYGIYSPSSLYNAAAIYQSASEDDKTPINVLSQGQINITDENSISRIYGLFNDSSADMYNAFTYAGHETTADNPSTFESRAGISITKDEKGSGSITGVVGAGNIYNAYSITTDGLSANAYATGNIEIDNQGRGQVIGIEGLTPTKKINNALAFLDSVVSDSVAVGNITVTGNNNVYGIYSNGSIANSETGFKKSFKKVNDFRARGDINVTARNDYSAYGMYIYNNGNPNVSLYNALGYRTIGNVNVINEGGGSAYGMSNLVKTYHVVEDGQNKEYYNNTYNAFRSSERYGDDDSAAEGTVTLEIRGNSNTPLQRAIGIQAAGDVFNAYAKSGSDVKLISLGTININDNSGTDSMRVKGIESGGKTIANAYATYGAEKNVNSATEVKGDININIGGIKSGTDGYAVGMYSDEMSTDNATIYNAALIDNNSNVEGNINMSATGGSTFNNMYGIYVARNDGTSDEGSEKTVYNAYYSNVNGVSAGHVQGKINMDIAAPSAVSGGGYYGIYVREGTAYNAYTTDEAADVYGEIKMRVNGGGYAETVGMSGTKAKLYNTGGTKSLIDVTSLHINNKAYGMKGQDSDIENNALINVVSEKSDAYGIYLNRGTVINGTDGVITVSGANNSYGIYALSKDSSGEAATATVVNDGTINLNGSNRNVGIYAEGSNVTVTNRGRININDVQNTEVCEGEDCSDVSAAIVLTEDAQLINSGGISSAGNLNLANMKGSVILDKNGTFEAEGSVSGKIIVSKNVVSDTFETSTVLSNAIKSSDTDDIELTSESYLYTPKLASSTNKQYNVVLDMKDFKEIADNTKEAAYLKKNYEQQRNAKLFNTLKSASDAAEEKNIKSQVMGTNMLPNITEEELKVQRDLDKTMMNDLFKDGEDIRKMVGAKALRTGRGDHDTLTGYDTNSQSMYMLYDKKVNNNRRLGLGLSLTHTDTDYNNDSRRKNFMVEGYIPLTYTNSHGISAVSMVRLGYADGDYTRRANNNSYKADTSAITYGLLNEVRYKKSLQYVNLTPFVGLNAIGWYQNSVSEGQDDLALHLDSSNVFSLEGALGIYVDKDIELNEDNRLNIALGIGYYHEFAKPYKGIDAHHTDMLNKFTLKGPGYSKDRGILSAKLNYDYKDFSIYGQLLQYLETEHPVEVEGGLQYRF